MEDLELNHGWPTVTFGFFLLHLIAAGKCRDQSEQAAKLSPFCADI